MTRTTGPGIGRQNNLGKQNVVKAQKQMGNTGLDGFKLHSGIS